jgi:sugar lactone lactonase YvrE
MINPESAVFHSETNTYYLSNFSGRNIIKIDSSGAKSVFKDGLSKPCGIVLCDSLLYVVDNPRRVLGFNLTKGEIILNIYLYEAIFLNDITSDDNGYLYVTDTRKNAIFKIDRINKSYNLFIETLMKSPNGIVYDKLDKRLLVCYFREKSTIDEIDIEEPAIRTLISTGFDNLDGITLDEKGNCYVSSFGPGNFQTGFKYQGTIYMYDKYFREKPEIISSNLFGPADIYYNSYKSELLIPLFLSHRIEFLNLN